MHCEGVWPAAVLSNVLLRYCWALAQCLMVRATLRPEGRPAKTTRLCGGPGRVPEPARPPFQASHLASLLANAELNPLTFAVTAMLMHTREDPARSGNTGRYDARGWVAAPSALRHLRA
jgi:hypothetical protein